MDNFGLTLALQELAHGLIFLVLFGFIAVVLWIFGRINLERRKMRLEAQNRLLDKITSAEALTAFLASEQGRIFLDRLKEPDETARTPNLRAAVAGLATVGLMALGLGVGMAISTEVDEPAGIITVGGAIGTLLAAGVQYLLYKRWRLIADRDEKPGPKVR